MLKDSLGSLSSELSSLISGELGVIPSPLGTIDAEFFTTLW